MFGHIYGIQIAELVGNFEFFISQKCRNWNLFLACHRHWQHMKSGRSPASLFSQSHEQFINLNNKYCFPFPFRHRTQHFPRSAQKPMERKSIAINKTGCAAFWKHTTKIKSNHCYIKIKKWTCYKWEEASSQFDFLGGVCF